MDSQSQSDKIAAVAVALLLILTAWGNAVIMLIVAVLGLVASVIYFRRRITRGGALSAILGFVVAVAIALIMLLP
jgi:hypothetical protein